MRAIEGKRKCPGFRNIPVKYDFPFAWMCSPCHVFAQRRAAVPPLLPPVARETLRKEENQVYRVSITFYRTYIGKMKCMCRIAGQIEFLSEMEKQLRLFERVSWFG